MPNAVIQPPKPGNCCHCGQVVPRDQHLRTHTIAGVGIEVAVTHCDDCVDTHEDCKTQCREEGT